MKKPSTRLLEGSDMIRSLAGRRVFVTGATGFIGGHLARRLHAAGAYVLALERTPGKGELLDELGIEIVRGDITDTNRMREFVARDVEIVMHIAAWMRGVSTREADVVNVAATRALAEASAEMGVTRFVYTSSIAVYGLQGNVDVDETTPVAPFGDPYADSKIRAEEALHEVGQRIGLPYVIVRPGMVYGPGSSGWTRRIALWAKRGRIPWIEGGQGSAFPCYIDNLIDLLLLCAIHTNAVGEIFNGVDDGPVTLAEFLGGYMQMVPTTRAIRLPCWLVHVAARVADPFVPLKLPYVVSQMCGKGQVTNQKAKDLLGWSPEVSLEEGLRLSEQWLRAEGIL